MSDYIIWEEDEAASMSPEMWAKLRAYLQERAKSRDVFLYGAWALPEHDTHWLNRLGEE